ncbi:MAG TPA: nitrate- and nitrite sensing domain-containing protein, partial [Amycolatopsis sp.]|nr:nitrate- and nitrite sensing domain-containing protein [Amycolatopsis sp.]
DDARSARTTADVASQARALGTLAWELQRERLLMAHYIASSSAGSSAMLKQQGVVAETVNRIRSQLSADAPEELAAALVRIGSLNEIRESALRRGASLDSVARTYHAVIDAVINSLRLVPQQTSDAAGTQQLTALDALLRANEENSLRGMALIIALVSPESGAPVLADAKQQSSLFLERFVQQADVTQATQVVAVEQGETGRRVDALEARLPEARGPQAVQNLLPDILGAVDAQSNQRRLAQDAVTTGITDAATARADAAQNLAWTIGIGAGVLFLLVGGLAIAVSRSIADPLRKLTTAATSVADLASTELVRVTDTEQAEELAPRLATIDVSSQDELGELAEAFNRVQATAAELVERQAVTRRNVGLMFANVAKRTQNLVGRQLALVDELERNEQDVALLASLYRLDHLSTRLRRNADNLLVVSGNRDEARISGPIELSTALRSALAEIEDYQRVRLGAMGDVLLSSPFGSDLVLIFAELLENATSFSPPESFVDVATKILPDGSCLIVIVDQGIGMTAERLAEENRRLVERERLELAPTSVLGLFVVGRLARRHGLEVELTETEPGAGITARLTIPPNLLTLRQPAPKSVPAPPVWPTAEPVDEPAPPSLPAPRAKKSGQEPPTLAIAGMIPRDGVRPKDFRWFRKTDGELSEAAPPAPPPAPAPEPVPAYQAPVPALTVADSGETRGGLRRRVKGAQLPGAPEAPSRLKSRHDPEAAKAAFDGFEAGLAKATTSPAAAAAPMSMPMPTPTPVPAASRGGLTRRVPGAQLAPGLAKGPAARHQTARAALNTTKPKGMRDPEAERAAFDAFSDGLEKAVNPEMEQREKSKR